MARILPCFKKSLPWDVCCLFSLILIPFCFPFFVHCSQFFSACRIGRNVCFSRIDRKYISGLIIICHLMICLALTPCDLHTFSIGKIISFSFSLVKEKVLISVFIYIFLFYQLHDNIFESQLFVIFVVFMSYFLYVLLFSSYLR